MTALLALAALAQERPVDIAKKDLPKAAECVVCSQNGEEHGMEKPVAGVVFRGKNYYFCHAGEVKTFKADPEGFLPPVLPRPMPAFDLADSTGKRWNGGAFKDRTVLIDWWASWCGPCKDMMPILDKIVERNRGAGLELLSVSIDEKRRDFEGFVSKRKFGNPVLWDDKQTWSGFGVKVIPMLFLVKDGQIVAQWRGKQKSEVIEQAVKKALTP